MPTSRGPSNVVHQLRCARLGAPGQSPYLPDRKEENATLSDAGRARAKENLVLAIGQKASVEQVRNPVLPCSKASLRPQFLLSVAWRKVIVQAAFQVRRADRKVALRCLVSSDR